MKYPDVHVQLTSHNGNAFAILGTIQNALRKAGVSVEERNNFYQEATSGDYDHLLQTCMKWVDVS